MMAFCQLKWIEVGKVLGLDNQILIFNFANNVFTNCKMAIYGSIFRGLNIEIVVIQQKKVEGIPKENDAFAIFNSSFL